MSSRVLELYANYVYNHTRWAELEPEYHAALKALVVAATNPGAVDPDGSSIPGPVSDAHGGYRESREDQ